MNRGVRALLAVIAVAAVVLLLFTVVFPWVDRMLADPTLGVAAYGG